MIVVSGCREREMLAYKKLPGGKGIPRAVQVLHSTLMYKFRDVCSVKVHKKITFFMFFSRVI